MSEKTTSSHSADTHREEDKEASPLLLTGAPLIAPEPVITRSMITTQESAQEITSAPPEKKATLWPGRYEGLRIRDRIRGLSAQELEGFLSELAAQGEISAHSRELFLQDRDKLLKIQEQPSFIIPKPRTEVTSSPRPVTPEIMARINERYLKLSEIHHHEKDQGD